jgi:hypothetical protein
MNKGCTLVFKDNMCVVSHNGEELFTAALQSKLFSINTSAAHTEMVMAVDGHDYDSRVDPQVVALWHQRMGHASESVLKSMISQGVVVGMNRSTDSRATVCEGCIMGKHTRESFKQQSSSRSTEILQLVHTDVGEANVPSWSGKVYYVTFIDDYSRRVWVYVINKKSDVSDMFIKWKTLVENQTQNTIKALRSDRGGEYINKKLQGVFDQYGIEHQTSMAESPQSNGVAERMNRTLWDQVRSMLYTAALPEQWWAETIMTAAYIHNRLVHTSTNGKTPMELWSGVKPDVSQMRVFGCVCYAHVLHSKRTKCTIYQVFVYRIQRQ